MKRVRVPTAEIAERLAKQERINAAILRSLGAAQGLALPMFLCDTDGSILMYLDRDGEPGLSPTNVISTKRQ